MKQFSPNEVTDEGIMIDVKLLQPEKHHPPNVVIDEGIIMEVKRWQPAKQLHPNEVTDEGISMDVNPLQPSYLQPIITQYFIDNKSEIWLLFLIAHSKRWRFNAFIDY